MFEHISKTMTLQRFIGPSGVLPTSGNLPRSGNIRFIRMEPRLERASNHTKAVLVHPHSTGKKIWVWIF